ncbi:hypothetical protein FWH58_01295 [Candidatus Saccharibacteria bacterium]|nr:hypothetical protein [Candidatus Saccharibacteria bacterium]
MIEYLITAAGGNATIIQELAKMPGDPTARGRELMARWPMAEQAGFLLRHQRYFAMAGGEFCGNAVRAAAILLNNFRSGVVEFRVSGFSGIVSTQVKRRTNKRFFVTATFPNLPIKIRKTIQNNRTVSIVDLGGIVHVVIAAAVPNNIATIQTRIINDLGLADRSAVGTIWLERIKEKVSITPIVWVRDTGTLFSETACGSGAIAAAIVAGARQIIQPTGQTITVDIGAGVVRLSSVIEVVDVLK